MRAYTLTTCTANNPKPITPFVTGLAYTALNQPKAWSWSNTDTASRTFDADGRMSANEFASHGYDAASRITSLTQNLWASQDITNPATGAVTTSTFTTPLTWSAGYDSRNRLTSFNRNGNSAPPATPTTPTATALHQSTKPPATPTWTATLMPPTTKRPPARRWQCSPPATNSQASPKP